MRTFNFITALILLAIAPVAFAAPRGELDATFGNAGRVKAFTDAAGIDVALQADGKIVAAGSTVAGGVPIDFVVTRSNADGTPDLQFGRDGIAKIDIAGGTDEASDLVLQPDGRIVIVGRAGVRSNRAVAVALVRLTPNGALDPTFDVDGKVTLELRGDVAPGTQHAILEPDGKLVVTSGMWNNADTDVAFVRLTSTGGIDTSFGTTGITIASAGHYDWPYDLVRQSDGRIVACGSSDSGGWEPDGQMFATRLDANGAIDTTFGSAGVWLRGSVPTVDASFGNSCVALPDDSLVIAGKYELLLLRANGTLDTSTWPQPVISLSHPDGRPFIHSVRLLADNRLGIVGSYVPRVFSNFFPGDAFVASLDLQTGVLDSSFGHQGLTVIDFRSADEFVMGEARELVQQPDGAIVVAGTSTTNRDRLTLARVRGDSLGSAGIVGFVQSDAKVSESAGQLTFHVRRSGGSRGALTVHYRSVPVSASSPDDYVAVDGTLQWADGEVGSKAIGVMINEDSRRDGDESFKLTLSAALPIDGRRELTIEIADNDAGNLTPALPSSAKTVGGGALDLTWMLMLLGVVLVRCNNRFKIA